MCLLFKMLKKINIAAFSILKNEYIIEKVLEISKSF